MKTAKQILSENRNSIISAIKFEFKVYSQKEITTKMIEFLAYAESTSEKVFEADAARNTKTQLRNMVSRMRYVQTTDERSEKKTMKVADILAAKEELTGERFDLRTYIANKQTL